MKKAPFFDSHKFINYTMEENIVLIMGILLSRSVRFQRFTVYEVFLLCFSDNSLMAIPLKDLFNSSSA